MTLQRPTTLEGIFYLYLCICVSYLSSSSSVINMQWIVKEGMASRTETLWWCFKAERPPYWPSLILFLHLCICVFVYLFSCVFVYLYIHICICVFDIHICICIFGSFICLMLIFLDSRSAIVYVLYLAFGTSTCSPPPQTKKSAHKNKWKKIS